MKTVLLFLCLFCYLIASAQDSTSRRPVLLSAVATYDFAKSYGASFEISAPFHSIANQNHHESSSVRTHKDQFISLELGMNRRPFAYTTAYFNMGVGLRFNRCAKHFNEVSFEQGIQRTFYDGKVYQEQPDGSIKERTLFGRTYASSGLSCAQNWSISNRSGNAWFIQLRPSIWIQYPYNSFVKPHFSLQAGLTYHLRDVSVHTRTKYKHQS